MAPDGTLSFFPVIKFTKLADCCQHRHTRCLALRPTLALHRMPCGRPKTVPNPSPPSSRTTGFRGEEVHASAETLPLGSAEIRFHHDRPAHFDARRNHRVGGHHRLLDHRAV